MLILKAPAKLNLYLHITGKRSDGYHLLDTVFQLIDLHDTIKLAARKDGRLVLHTPIAGLANTEHLAMKAATLLKTHSKTTLGADIWVEKRIPSGAGLGGGSSDAATTLLGLNQLWQCGLDNTQRQSLGLELGADVPFFCSTLGTAHAQGIGEVLTALAPQGKHYLVVFPDCHVPTPAVFKHPNLVWNAERVVNTHFSSAFAAGLQNDLQAPAQLIAPPILKALRWLEHAPQCEGVRMSGSGSAVFAQFANESLASLALEALETKRPAGTDKWRVWQVKGLEKHPVMEALSSLN